MFSIDGDQVILDQPLVSNDLIPEYFIRIQSLDKEGAYAFQSFSFPVNHTPSDISITATSFSESINGGSVVARLSAVDSDDLDSHVLGLLTVMATQTTMFYIVDDRIVVNRHLITVNLVLNSCVY